MLHVSSKSLPTFMNFAIFRKEPEFVLKMQQGEINFCVQFHNLAGRGQAVLACYDFVHGLNNAQL